MRITKIEKCKKSKGRYNIFLNDTFAFSIFEELVISFGLKEDELLEQNKQIDLKKADEKIRATNMVYRFLSYRARSEKELNEYLSKKGFEKETLEHILNKLKHLGYINDLQFAKDWVQSRIKKKGKFALNRELILKGIDEETRKKVLEDSGSEVDFANNLILKKIGIYSKLDEQKKKEKIFGYLSRRGYSYDTVKEILDRHTKKGR